MQRLERRRRILASRRVEVLALLAKQSLSRSFDHLQHFTASPDADQAPEAPLSYSEKHQRQVRLGKPQVTDLVEKYLAGASVLMLAEEFGIHRTTVTAHLERHGVPRRACVRRLTDADVQEAACHYVAGESLLDVGRRYGVDPATIAREFRNAGVEIRARRGWTDGPPQAESANSDAGE